MKLFCMRMIMMVVIVCYRNNLMRNIKCVVERLMLENSFRKDSYGVAMGTTMGREVGVSTQKPKPLRSTGGSQFYAF